MDRGVLYPRFCESLAARIVQGVTHTPLRIKAIAELVHPRLPGARQVGPFSLEGGNNPVKVAKTIKPDGSLSDGANPVVGLSFIDADDIDAAVELAKTCPHLAAGGSIEVAELTNMDASVS